MKLKSAEREIWLAIKFMKFAFQMNSTGYIFRTRIKKKGFFPPTWIKNSRIWWFLIKFDFNLISICVFSQVSQNIRNFCETPVKTAQKYSNKVQIHGPFERGPWKSGRISVPRTELLFESSSLTCRFHSRPDRKWQSVSGRLAKREKKTFKAKTSFASNPRFDVSSPTLARLVVTMVGVVAVVIPPFFKCCKWLPSLRLFFCIPQSCPLILNGVNSSMIFNYNFAFLVMNLGEI